MDEEMKTADPAAVEAPEEGKKGKKDKPKKSVGGEILSWVKTIVAALLIAFVIRSFIFEPVKVDGASMNDTLANGEIMLVTKFSGSTAILNVPFFGHRAGTYCTCPKIVVGGNPARFDAVICRYVLRGDTNFVKRVVGLPGDTVEIKSGYLYVNGEKYDENYINDDYRTGNYKNYKAIYVPKQGETLKVENGVVTLNGEQVSGDLRIYGVYDKVHRVLVSNGKLYIEDPELSVAKYNNTLTQEMVKEGRAKGYVFSNYDAGTDIGLLYAMYANGAPVLKPVEDGTEITFAEDNIMVMGDHRNASNDSRQEGTISRCMVLGHVGNVVWPLGNMRGIPNGLNVQSTATETPAQ